MNTTQTSRPKSVTILVAKSGVRLSNQANATENLIDPATSAVNLADGQLAIVCDTHNATARAYNELINTTDTAILCDEIRIVQGTPYSANFTQVGPLPTSHQAFVSSRKIKAKGGVAFTAKLAKQSANDAWIIGGASSGILETQDEASYKLNLQFLSARNDREYSISGNDNLTINFTSPDYTSLGTTNPLDHLVQNIAYNTNLNSAALRNALPFVRNGNKNVVAFAINFAGGAGTAMNGFVAGTPFNAMVSNGITLTYTPDAAFVKTMANVVANSTDITNATTVEVIDLSTAGAAAKTQAIMLVALDHQLAVAHDEELKVKVRLNVGLETSFTPTVRPTKFEASKPYEGEGSSRSWQLEYNNRARLNVFSQQARMYGDYFIEAPSYILPDIYYTAYIIDSKDEQEVAYSHMSEYFHRTIILVPSPLTSGTGVTDANTATDLNAYLGQWFTSLRSIGKLDSSIPAAASFFI